ncbi:homeobox-leucine zipper protein athb-15 [Phtheirospermum japonicum]|uniref:Homeobox-leucine zipper protein athb-15 n=1 Tax=Phtheirospermum japonicum TaxID=374723 RepID=A0A830DL47_9LAMI|nr:homeobox-leucine zipper protein athb-15 [Phtheirospermum japonicum]
MAALFLQIQNLLSDPNLSGKKCFSASVGSEQTVHQNLNYSQSMPLLALIQTFISIPNLPQRHRFPEMIKFCSQSAVEEVQDELDKAFVGTQRLYGVRVRPAWSGFNWNHCYFSRLHCVASHTCGLVGLEPTRVTEILKDRPSGYRDCRAVDVLSMLSTGNDGNTEFLYMQALSGVYKTHILMCILSFVRVVDENVMWMHDQLKEMGREIVWREDYVDSGQRSRLWDRDEILKVLKNEKYGSGRSVARFRENDI